VCVPVCVAPLLGAGVGIAVPRLNLVAYNLGNLWQRLALPKR
jgi:hypothetical protein